MATAVFEMAVLAGPRVEQGPSPSELSVELGAETHCLRKMPSPTLKSSWRSNDRLADGCENALALRGLKLVALPPGRSSPGMDPLATARAPASGTSSATASDSLISSCPTLSGASRLSEPSNFTRSSLSAATTRSSVLVWSASRSMAVWMVALP